MKIGIVGGTGYTGVELLRLLAQHPEAELQVITSRSQTGRAVCDLFPSLRGKIDLTFTEPKVQSLYTCDLVFFATPNGVAMEMVPDLLKHSIRVIDLAADFRLKSPQQWEQWYKMPHQCPELLKQAVYGLPEIHRNKIQSAQLVANPGCYPTAVQLGFLPLLENNIIQLDDLIADTKSGVSGAGRSANIANLMTECSESLKAYAIPGHRHLPEICQGLERISQQQVKLTFVPHLTPMIRGIHATLYATPATSSLINLQNLFETRFADEYFVDVLPTGSHPATSSVKGSNFCRIAVHQAPETDKIIILSVIDNLIKGAAGQAIQNMNIMYHLKESTGLDSIALFP